jgi:integrase
MTIAYEVGENELFLIHDAMCGEHKNRNRLVWILGCWTGYRISELLSLRIRDVFRNGKVSEYLQVMKKNMKKDIARPIPPPIPEWMHELIKLHVAEMIKKGYISEDCYLFVTRNGKQLDRKEFARIIKRSCKVQEIDSTHITTHTMRKTFVMNNYRRLRKEDKYKNDASALFLHLMKITGHKCVESLIKYIRIVEDRAEQFMREAMDKPKLVRRLGYG